MILKRKIKAVYEFIHSQSVTTEVSDQNSILSVFFLKTLTCYCISKKGCLHDSVSSVL